MSFLETVERARAFLERNGRVSLRALQTEFDLDDAAVDDLIDELVEIQRVAERDGRALAWKAAGTQTPAQPLEGERAPRDYTPKHLAEKILQSKSAVEGERKQVTVLFADIKDSMDVAERVDPEQWHKILERFFQILTDGVHRFEGTVNQYTGDGIMALFGAPIAHEDHAQRACYAALLLRDRLRRFSGDLRESVGLDFATRMGIHTGDVVVGKIGDDLRMDYTAQGHTVGLAARMEKVAPAHGICISGDTAELVSGFVSLRDVGAAPVKGASTPVSIFELEGEGTIGSRFEQSQARGLTRFVGREDDMAVLEQALEQARSGNGQVVGVVAEAGAGKSRLCFEFVERCRERGVAVLRGAAAAHGRNVPLLPILQLLRQYFSIAEDDDACRAREKIESRLIPIDPEFRDLLPVVFDFMGVAEPENPPAPTDPATRQRQLSNVMRAIVQRDVDVPVLFIEDLHWIDAGSEAWLEQIVEAVAGSNTLLLVNFRPEYDGAWMNRSWYRQLPLLPLSAEALRELLGDLLGVDPSTAGLADAIYERSGGNPFFAEEIVQELIESGNLERMGPYRLVTPVGQLEVPGTVQSVLAARIDRLGEREKEVLQAASVIGREFSETVLAAVLDCSADDLAAPLRTLRNAEFLYERSLYPVAEYAFKHPLTQEVAFGSQLRERRAKTHAAVAEALEKFQPERADENAALLAHHYEEAGESLRAAHWHSLAGNWLIERDLAESSTHWFRVYELAKSVPASTEAESLVLAACIRLVLNSFMFELTDEERIGFAAEGRVIAERSNNRVGIFLLELGFTVSRILSGSWSESPLISARRALEVAPELGHEAHVSGLTVLSNALWLTGRLPEALRRIEEALEMAGDDLEIGVSLTGFSSPNFSRFQKGAILMWMGRPDEASKLFEQSLAVAAERKEDTPICQINCWRGAAFEDITGISSQALARSKDAVAAAERTGDLFNHVIASLYLGWAQLLEGSAATEAVKSLLQADHFQRERGIGSTGLNLGQALLAEAHVAAGDFENARSVLNRYEGDRDSWAYDLRGHIGRARAWRGIAGAGARVEVESALDCAEDLLEKSSARGFEPLIVEERARLLEALGDAEDARRTLRSAQSAYSAVDAVGHAERLARELGS